MKKIIAVLSIVWAVWIAIMIKIGISSRIFENIIKLQIKIYKFKLDIANKALQFLRQKT